MRLSFTIVFLFASSATRNHDVQAQSDDFIHSSNNGESGGIENIFNGDEDASDLENGQMKGGITKEVHDTMFGEVGHAAGVGMAAKGQSKRPISTNKTSNAAKNINAPTVSSTTKPTSTNNNTSKAAKKNPAIFNKLRGGEVVTPSSASPTRRPSKAPSTFLTGSASSVPTSSPTGSPSSAPTLSPRGTPTEPVSATGSPTTKSPTTRSPSSAPTLSPRGTPTEPVSATGSPSTRSPTTRSPSSAPTSSPTGTPTEPVSATGSPTTKSPTTGSPSSAPTLSPRGTPTEPVPATGSPTTRSPTTRSPTTRSPTTRSPTTRSPTTGTPTTRSPTTESPTTESPTTAEPALCTFSNKTCPNDKICLQNCDYGIEDETRFNIDLSLELSSTVDTTKIKEAYASALAKWTEVISGDILPVPGQGKNPGNCTNPPPDLIDDLYICSSDQVIDGPGKILGSAGPVRILQDLLTDKWTARTGRMTFDTADLSTLAADGTIKDVILHEMGHVIGIGTLWDNNNLIDGNNDYREDTRATAVWRNDWGCIGTPPVEKDGGKGTAFSHWDETCLGVELMTGFVTKAQVKFSNLTIASIEDIGYDVNYGAADTFDGSNSPCCKSGARSLSFLRTPGLSEDGTKEAVSYGQNLLSESRLSEDQEALLQEEDDDTGLTYVGDRFVVVLYIEDGHIYEVLVTKNDE